MAKRVASFLRRLLFTGIAVASYVSASAVVAAAATRYPGGSWEPGEPPYGSTIVDHVSIKMDDGVTLDATVAYPTDLGTGQRAQGKFPVVVEDTPYTYEKIPPNLEGPVNTYFAKYGYISVRFHSRGTGTSTGANTFSGPREAKDGAAVIQWAGRELDGSDGRVALVGCSFPGMHALGDAAAVGPNSPLKATVAACTALETVERHDQLISGVPTQDVAFNYSAPKRLMTGNKKTVEFNTNLSDEILRGGDAAYVRDFWKERLPMSHAQKIVDNGVPVLLWIGWEDQVGIGALRTYAAFQNAAHGLPIYVPMRADQPTTPRYQLIVGGWKHGRGLDNGIILQWLETWVKGVDTGIQNTKTPMHLFEMGTNHWVNAAHSPMVEEYASWSFAKGALVTAAPTADSSETLAWGDPTKEGNKLTFNTPSFPDGLTIAGPISTTVYASSSNTNIHLLAHLFDVAADNTVVEITQGSILGSLRELDPNKSWTDKNGTPVWPWQILEKDSFLTPGEVYRLDIVMEPRQWGVLPGHKLRVELTTQAVASLCPGPQEDAPGNDPCYLTESQKMTVPGGTYTIMYGPTHRSQLNLPQMPANALADGGCKITPTSGDYCMPISWGEW